MNQKKDTKAESNTNDQTETITVHLPTDLYDILTDACPPHLDISTFAVQLLQNALDLRRMMKTIIGRAL